MKEIESFIKQMTLEEKAGLCSGLTFWHTKPVERLGIPSIMMCDGPHGLRKESKLPDRIGFQETVPATCFSTASLTACSWDPEVAFKIGEAVGLEAQANQVSIVLGPGANIKRSPLCGRNFEYMSEDPYLSSRMAAGLIEGLQSREVGASLKHFAANNQEHKRLVIDAQIPERPLRELYLASFEHAVKAAKPDTVMCAYNSVNGDYCSQNKRLLTEILRDEWGFEGFVMSDWGAVDDRAKGLAAGLDLEMPSSGGYNDAKLVEAVQNGTLAQEALDRAAARILKFVLTAAKRQREGVTFDEKAHHRLAAELARECMVLLKNEGALPLHKQGDYAVIGALAKTPRYQGSGSSRINPTMVSSILDGIAESAPEALISYEPGYSLEHDEPDDTLIAKAVQAAKGRDAVILVTGLPDSYESEGYDRAHMRIPEAHMRLIKAVAKANPNLVIVLCNGAPVEMPWIGSAKAVLEAYLGGQAGGIAAAQLLFGDANPCGKLAESFPVRLEDNPTFLNFPGEGNVAPYAEGLFVGYRYYDKKRMEPLFPFGFGLSYTQYEYSDLRLSADSVREDAELTVTFKVKNTGAVAGKEIVQLYVRDVQSSVIRPEKELKAFAKIALAPGEEKEVALTLNRRAFAFYCTAQNDWRVESGEFELLVGASSRDIRLCAAVTVKALRERANPVDTFTTFGELKDHPAGKQYYDLIAAAFGMNADTPPQTLEMTHGLPISKAVTMGFTNLSWGMLDRIINEINEQL